MKIRGLLVAVAVLAALGAASYWSEKKKKADEKKPASDAAPKLLSIPEDQIKSVALKKTSGELTMVTRTDAGKWQIVQPKALPADQDSISSLVSTLSSLNSERLIEEKASDLTPFGLSSPREEVTVTQKDGKTQKLLLGEDTPTGGGSFAKLDGDSRVFTVGSWVKSSLDKSSKDLRDKRLLTFDSDKLTRLEVQAKGKTAEFGKNNQNDWQILKPRPLRADGSQVEELIRKLKDAKMDASVSEEDAKKAASAYAAGTRVAVATVTDATGNQQLEVHKDKDKNYYAKSSAVEGIHKVGSDLGEALDKNVDDFRNKKLFDFGWSDPTKLEIRGVTYQKSAEKWMMGSKQMDSSSIQTLIDKLRDLSAKKFVESGYGTPILEAAVTSNDGKRVEKAGISRQGDSYFAKRENEPSIYELDAKPVEELQKAASEVKEFQPPKDQKKK
jgi:hypothetical protein